LLYLLCAEAFAVPHDPRSFRAAAGTEQTDAVAFEARGQFGCGTRSENTEVARLPPAACRQQVGMGARPGGG
jgi:hypothetical protein